MKRTSISNGGIERKERRMPVAEIDGVEIGYETRGEGPPLVLLHCWTGNRAFYFNQVEKFSRDYRCVAVDFPGHGESGRCSDYSVQNFTRLVVGLLEELGVENAVFVGHSLGGMVCQNMALEHPEMVEGLVLLDTTPHLAGWFPQSVVSFTAVVLGMFGFKAAKAVVAGTAATHPLATPRSRVITARECSKVRNVPMVRTLYQVRVFDATGKLGSITQPTLIVVGTADLLADIRHARKMARDIPNSTLKIVHGAGHMALFEKPEVVNRAMEDFLNRAYPAGKAKNTKGAR